MTVIKLGEVIDKPQHKRMQMFERAAEERRLAQEARRREEEASATQRIGKSENIKFEVGGEALLRAVDGAERVADAAGARQPHHFAKMLERFLLSSSESWRGASTS